MRSFPAVNANPQKWKNVTQTTRSIAAQWPPGARPTRAVVGDASTTSEAERREATAKAAGAEMRAAAAARKEAECPLSIECWGKKHRVDATIACEPHIENLAQYVHEWTNGFLEQKFDSYRWDEGGPAGGNVLYTGDKIRFQNAFGAWVPHRYSCLYNPARGRVISVNAERR